MAIVFEEKVWTVTRQAGAAAGARGAGEYEVKPQEAGIWLHSDKGDRLFLPMDTSTLPTQEELNRLSIENFRRLLKGAERR